MSYILTQVNEGITITLQNFVEAKPYIINVSNPHLHISTILQWFIKQFLSFISFKMSFNYI